MINCLSQSAPQPSEPAVFNLLPMKSRHSKNEKLSLQAEIPQSVNGDTISDVTDVLSLLINTRNDTYL